MHALSLGILALQTASAVLGNPLPQTDAGAIAAAEGVDELAALARSAYEKTEELLNSGDLQKRGSTCNLGNIKIRKEWGSLSKRERLDYVKAVQCLSSKPARTPSEVVPGAKTRFDDFVATHINQTFTIHATGTFLSWHRQFTWLYEEALREECGYTGTQPYWDWTKSAITGLEKSPIFDGSETSISGDGEFIDNKGDLILTDGDGNEITRLPTGTGGGCVKSGPFKNFTVNLGPVALALPGGGSEMNPEGLFAYNPRCLKRDLTTEINRRYCNATAVIRNIVNPRDIASFQDMMQGLSAPANMLGIHGGGHYSFGGDPARDFFTSPGDPVFYLHHAMIDRVWWMWQMLSPYDRQFTDKALAGTNTFMNLPPSANTTFEDILEYGYTTDTKLKVGDALSTVAGPYCYIYL
ncbi:tyrosinase central domain protein [Colletotrichum truncatum]|uniref:Tyrosinase central domain protein n=1 Tax=Colletotrichum truncatum TaxID=5467 RepID=A0ACC3YKA4_COLTU|nr:tyrosinase central domain protein [Colletotrichum truncatum]KAF6784412.1 tyrosinase central domain protein [Colletotrichum truncatum]